MWLWIILFGEFVNFELSEDLKMKLFYLVECSKLWQHVRQSL